MLPFSQRSRYPEVPLPKRTNVAFEHGRVYSGWIYRARQPRGTVSQAEIRRGKEMPICQGFCMDSNRYGYPPICGSICYSLHDHAELAIGRSGPSCGLVGHDSHGGTPPEPVL